MQSLEALFQRLGIARGDVAGASFGGEIPVSEALVNRLIAGRIGQHPYIQSLRVTLLADDQALVRVEPRSRLMPSVPISVRIERQPDLPRDATLLLRWSIPNGGPLALVAKAAVGYLRSLPDGIRMDGDIVAVDLWTLLRSRGLEDVAGLLRRVAVHTRPGALMAQLEARLD